MEAAAFVSVVQADKRHTQAVPAAPAAAVTAVKSNSAKQPQGHLATNCCWIAWFMSLVFALGIAFAQ